MTQKKKNNIIIGSLCAVVLLMVVGYAAFSSVLNIKGTSSISSNWNIKITKIEEKSIVGGAETATNATGEKKISGIGTLTASFETNLVSPGDSIEYDITVSNEGSLNAKLDKITLSESNNPAIKFTSSGLEEGSELNAGGTAILTVKVEYLNSVTSQPDNKKGTLTVTLDYSQKEGNGAVNQNAADKLIATTVSSGDGLYADEYESGRYVYKGGNPNNYITFNGEEAGWRIISVESDGTLKIMKNGSIGNKAFDSKGLRDSGSNGAGGTYCTQNSDGCNAWAINDNFINEDYVGTVLKDAELNTYLNEKYYGNLSVDSQNLIVSHSWSVGPIISSNNDLAVQIQSEDKIKWMGKIALISASDYLRANTNMVQCGNYELNNTNYNICKTSNYMVPESGWLWTVSPYDFRSTGMLFITLGGTFGGRNASINDCGVSPSLYLTTDIKLSGSGTSDDPYTIISE